MKNILVGILIAAFGVYGYFHVHRRADALQAEESGEQDSSGPESGAAASQSDSMTVAFHCDGRVYCSQMKSYDEAVYFLRHCPGVKMDGDNDGVPCERQFDK